MANTNCSPYHLGMNQYRNSAGTASNFTFTTPTQCTTLGTPRPCIETISPINLSAPGVGASWQHSIPTTMPWIDMAAAPQNVPVGSATVFTGLPFNILPGPTLACHNTPRGSKRKSLDVSSEAPASKVHLCADQLANMRITPVHHANSEAAQISDQQYGSGIQQCETSLGFLNSANRSEEWERFRELEDRLSIDGDEESSLTEDSPKEGMHIRVADDVIKSLAENNSPILPREIVEDVQKPCMQIVLWQSPEKLINNMADKDSSEESQSVANTSTAGASNLTSKSFSTTQASVTFTDPNVLAANSTGISHMDAISPEPMFDFQRSSILGSEPLFQSSPFSMQTNPACRLSPSPGFLRPLSSSSGSPFSAFPSSSSFYTPAFNNPVNYEATPSSVNYFNNNNNVLSNNNVSNAVTLFDSVDDEMQL